MIFTFGKIVLDIDAERTRTLYDRLDVVTAGCSCGGCRNFARAAADFPPEVLSFFQKLGVDPVKACEVIPYCAEDEGRSMFYGGFYHLCGRILAGEDGRTDADGVCSSDPSGDYAIAQGYSVGFTSRISLPEEALTAPAIQMEIGFHGVPWKLCEKNPY